MKTKTFFLLAALLAVVGLLAGSLYTQPDSHQLTAAPAWPTLPTPPVYQVTAPVSTPVAIGKSKAKKHPAKHGVAKTLPALRVSQAQQDRNADCAMAWLTNHLHVREATGNNDGPEVTAIILQNGGKRREPYCGYSQAGANRSCGLPTPQFPGGSYLWFLDRTRNVLKGATGSFDKVRRGYKIGIFNAYLGRIAHITAADEVILRRDGNRARGAWCIGGNEGRKTNAGFHRTFYPAVNCNAAANWNY